MILLDLITAVEDWAEFKPLTTSAVDGPERARAVRYINESIYEMSLYHNWSWMERHFYLISRAEQTTGTISVANGSDTATLSTAIAYDPVGRKLLAASDEQPYLIIGSVVGSTSTALTITPPYQGTTCTTAGYSIFSERFVMPQRTKHVESPMWGQDSYQPIEAYPGANRETIFRKPNESGEGVLFTRVEPSVAAWYESSGTIGASVGAGSTAVTMTGVTPTTEWIGRYIRFAGETKDYEIAGKTNATTIRLGCQYSGTQGASTGFAIDGVGSPCIQIAYWPADAEVINATIYVFPTTYDRNSDVIPISDVFRNCIIEGAKWRHLEDTKDDKAAMQYAKFIGVKAGPGQRATGMEKLIQEDKDFTGESANVVMQDWVQRGALTRGIYFNKITA